MEHTLMICLLEQRYIVLMRHILILPRSGNFHGNRGRAAKTEEFFAVKTFEGCPQQILKDAKTIFAVPMRNETACAYWQQVSIPLAERLVFAKFFRC